MMRAAVVAIVLFAALPAVAEAQQEPVELRFAIPAQVEGHLGVEGVQWLLVVFDPAAAAVADLTSPAGGSLTEHRQVGYRLDAPQGSDDQALAPTRGTLPPGFSASLTLAGGRWSSLFLVADAISVRLAAPEAHLGFAQAAEPAVVRLGDGFPAGTVRERSPTVPDASVALDAAGRTGIPLLVEATGLRAVEWYNATVACASPDACPDGPAYMATAVGSPAAGAPRIEQRTFTRLEVPRGTLSASGEAVAFSAGGSVLQMDVHGSARLPDAQTGERPSASWLEADGEAVRAQGDLLLQGLRGDGPGHLAATMSGRIEAASVGQRPMALGPAAAVAGGAALAIVLVVKLAFALVSRAQDRHERADRLLATIQARPGLSFRALMRATGLANGAARHHLATLLDAGLVTARAYRNTIRYFENHGRYDADWQQIIPLLDEDTRRLHQWMLAHPDVHQAAIVQAAAQWGWSRAKCQRRLRGLVEAALVRVRRAGGNSWYAATDGATAPALAAGLAGRADDRVAAAGAGGARAG